MQSPIDTLLTGQLDSRTFRQPDPIPLRQKQLAVYVGLVAFCLPVVLYIGTGIAPFCRPSSISHSYYVPFFGPLFIAAMGFIAVFLFCFPGHSKADGRLATLAGAAARGVALFPTARDGCALRHYTGQVFVTYREGPEGSTVPELFYDYLLFPDVTLLGQPIGTQVIHFLCAGILFAILGFFSLWSFRRNNGEGVIAHPDGSYAMSVAKRRRNRIYTLCGLVIFACMALLPLFGQTGDGVDTALPPVFVIESVALFAFGLSWVVKGRLLPLLREPEDRALARPVRPGWRKATPPPRSTR